MAQAREDVGLEAEDNREKWTDLNTESTELADGFGCGG